jgi:hypothetical protein
LFSFILRANIPQNFLWLIFVRSDLKATFHLGDDREWENGSMSSQKYNIANYASAYNLRKVWPNICEFQVDSDANQTRLQAGKSKHIGNYNSCTRLAIKFWNNGYDPCNLAKCTEMNSTVAMKNRQKRIVPEKLSVQ